MYKDKNVKAVYFKWILMPKLFVKNNDTLYLALDGIPKITIYPNLRQLLQRNMQRSGKLSASPPQAAGVCVFSAPLLGIH
jgi:hypothetical protein